MRRALALALAASFFGAGCARAPKKDSHYDRGVWLIRQGKTDEAILEFQQSLRIEPEDPTVHNALGEAYYSKGFREQAIAAWEKALQTGSTDPAFYQQGGKNRSAEWIQDGIEAYKAARKSAVKAWMEEAEARQKRGALPEAVELWKKVVAVQDDHVEAWRLLGKAYKKQKDMQAAYQAWKKVAALSPKEIEVAKEYGYAAFATGHLSEAEGAFRRWAELDDGSAVALNNLGAVLAKLERFEEAYQAFDKALSKQPDMIAALNGKGTAYYYQKRYEEARKLWAKVLELAPDDPTAKENIRTLIKMGY